jgi:hypothetical protein
MRPHTIAVAFLLTASVAADAAAQPPSSIDYARRLRELADSRAEADAKNAIAAADKAATPAAAVRDLSRAIRALDLSADVTSTKRAELVKLLQAKADALEGRGPVAVPTPGTVGPKPVDVRKLREDATAETADVRAGLAEVKKLYAADKFAAAQGVINGLARKYPDNPAVFALAGQGYARDRVAAADELARQMAERTTLALNDVQRSAMPAKGDIEFPPGWKEKMDARDKAQFEQLDAETVAILEALDKPVKQGIPSGPFREVVQALSDATGKPIYLNEDALKEAGIDMLRPVSMPGGVSARTALRAVLQANRLTFIVKERAIMVVTPEEARTMLVKRAYYMGDVLSTPFGGGATLGPLLDFDLAVQSANMIIDSIKKSIDPLGWQNPAGGGGNSSILFHAPSMSIIVSAPAEVHYSLGRAVRGKK